MPKNKTRGLKEPLAILAELQAEGVLTKTEDGFVEYGKGYSDAAIAAKASKVVGRELSQYSVSEIRREMFGDLRRVSIDQLVQARRTSGTKRKSGATVREAAAIRSELAALKALVSELAERIR